MHLRRVPRGACICVLTFATVLSVWVWHELSSQRRNREMVARIRSGDYRGALNLLRSGADPNAGEAREHRETLLRRIFDMIHREPGAGAAGLSAAEVLFTPEREFDRRLTIGRMEPGRFAVLRFLVTHGANVNQRDDSYAYGEDTPLAAYAARFGYSDCLTLLIDYGADVNATNREGESLLMFAVDPYTKRYPAQVDTARLLLERGANPQHKSSTGDTALSYAEEVKDRAIIQMLTKRWR